jgi:hypothetical protein
MTKDRRLPPLPPARRRISTTHNPARRNDILRRGVVAALRGSGRYSVFTNVSVLVPDSARTAVRRAGGSYVAATLPLAGECETVIIDLLVVDERNGWAGAYAFCRHGAPSRLARNRIEDNLRATELVLRAHLRQKLSPQIDTVTIGVIDGSAEPENSCDLTIAACEIAGHFEIEFRDEDVEDLSFGPSKGAPGG